MSLQVNLKRKRSYLLHGVSSGKMYVQEVMPPYQAELLKNREGSWFPSRDRLQNIAFMQIVFHVCCFPQYTHGLSRRGHAHSMTIFKEFYDSNDFLHLSKHRPPNIVNEEDLIMHIDA